MPESDNVVSVYVTGRHLDRLPARAGQFCIWRFPGHNGWWQANPFSLSAAPDGAFAAADGQGRRHDQRRAAPLPVGSRVFVEGPYGAFTSLHQAGPAHPAGRGRRRDHADPRAAGGVAVGPSSCSTGCHTAADAVLLGELQELAQHRGARLHLLAGRTGAGQPAGRARSTRSSLAALVPDIRAARRLRLRSAAMTEAVLRSVRVLSVPRAQVHAERFGLG